MKKTIIFLLVILLMVALSGCGQRNENRDFNNTTEPPVRIPDTLEERFDQAQSGNGIMACITEVISFPTGFPTERLSFSTPGRFSISYEVRIAVADRDNAIEVLNGFSEEVGNFSLVSTNDGTIVEATLAVEFEDLDNTFTNLYRMGVVEEYRITVFDMTSIDEDDDSEYWQARWAENNTIVISFVEEV